MGPKEKLDLLRKRMQELDLDVYLVPTDDPHLSGMLRLGLVVLVLVAICCRTTSVSIECMSHSHCLFFVYLYVLSEYVPEAYKRREFLTGFSGSAGTAVVTATEALLWTDSRYWNEASLQIDADLWKLQKAGLPSTPTIAKWLASTAVAASSKPLRIGMDPHVHAASFAKDVTTAMEEAVKEEEQKPDAANDVSSTASRIGTLVTEHPNLIDPIWGDARPALPEAPFRAHPLEYAGLSVSDKIARLREEMVAKNAVALVLCSLDDIAYTFNLRATGDIDTCPVGIAYGIVYAQGETVLYCNPTKAAGVADHLAEGNVVVRPYEHMLDDVKAIPNGKVWLDTTRANLALFDAIPSERLVDAQNPVTPMKAAKNSAELDGMREAHIVDGAAMAEFMAWLEEEVQGKGRAVSEVEIDTVLTGCRAKQKGFIECSFPTIAGVGSNGAIIHYRAQPDTDLLKYLDTSAPILIDSGGQYTYGTTDVTRTWSFQSPPSPEFINYYTRVLKGNIGVDTMVFPENTPGFVLDVYARRWLWDIGVDYGHGTGHGVGAALNVHEGPMSISPRWKNKEGLKAGMVVSNEPGYYEDGNFGIRIENLLEICPVQTNEDTTKADDPSKKKFLKFSKLTMIPIQKNLINVSLMSSDELDWLDRYHAEVLEKVGARLEPGSPAAAWLAKSCAPIDRT